MIALDHIDDKHKETDGNVMHTSEVVTSMYIIISKPLFFSEHVIAIVCTHSNSMYISVFKNYSHYPEQNEVLKNYEGNKK